MPDVAQTVSERHPAPVVTIRLPAAFHALTGGRKQVSAEGGSIRDLLVDLDRSFPGVIERIMDDEGGVKRYVNIYLNDDDIRGLNGLETRLTAQDVIWIIPAVAGGSGTARS